MPWVNCHTDQYFIYIYYVASCVFEKLNITCKHLHLLGPHGHFSLCACDSIYVNIKIRQTKGQTISLNKDFTSIMAGTSLSDTRNLYIFNKVFFVVPIPFNRLFVGKSAWENCKTTLTCIKKSLHYLSTVNTFWDSQSSKLIFQSTLLSIYL